MAFNLNNFVIDKCLRGAMISTDTGEVLWSITQIESPSLSVTSSSTDAVDALGTPIVTFERGKQAEFKASNSLFDLGLAAAQFGTTKSVASATNTIETPIFEEIVIPSSATTVTLAHTPIGSGATGIPYIYKLNGDSTEAARYAYAATAAADKFTYSAATLTFPTGLSAGDHILVIYNYSATGGTDLGAVSVTNSATNFPTAGKFVLEVLGSDVCNTSVLYYAYIILPNAKLMSDVDLTFSTDGKHAFTLKAMQAYCDHEKKLFQIIVPEDVD